MEHTKLPWEANKFTKLDGSEITTVDDVIECLTSSAKLAGGIELYGISSSGDEKIICYTGNGETSKANAAFIVKACNCHDDLLEACKEALSIIEKYSDVPVHIFALKAAIAKAEA